MTTPVATSALRPTRFRRVASWVLLYVFGLAVTTLLLGVWGRAVTGDPATMAAGVRAAVEAHLVADRMEDWLADAAAGSGDGPAAGTVHRVVTSPEVQRGLDVMVATIVEGVVGEPPAGGVDVGAVLAPVGRVVSEELAAAGAAVSAEEVTAGLSELEPIVLAVADGGISGAVSTAEGLLTVAAVVATVVALVTGGASVALAPDRVAMARTLAVRVAVGALSFILVTRIGAWALDPDGGRSPVAAGASVLLRSHTGVLAAIMVAAALAGTGLGAHAMRRRRTRIEPGPPGDGAVDGDADDPDRTTETLVSAGT